MSVLLQPPLISQGGTRHDNPWYIRLRHSTVDHINGKISAQT